jgi:hypothetical protein
LVLVDVGRSVGMADIWQAGAAGLEPLQGSPVGRLRSLVDICRVRIVLVCASWVRTLRVSVCLTRVYFVRVSRVLVSLTRV